MVEEPLECSQGHPYYGVPSITERTLHEMKNDYEERGWKHHQAFHRTARRMCFAPTALKLGAVANHLGQGRMVLSARSHTRPNQVSHGRKRMIKIDSCELEALLEPQMLRSLSVLKAPLEREWWGPSAIGSDS
jgi:hypothetical protein